MKNRYLSVVYALTSLIVALAVTGAVAEDDQKPRFSAVIFESVAPALTAEYEEGTRKMMALLKSHKAPFSIRVRKRWNGDYTYATPITSMATMDEYSRYWREAAEEMNKTEWGRLRQTAVNSTRYTVWLTDTPMSYWPVTLNYDLSKTRYFMVYRLRIKHAHEREFVDSMLKMRAWTASISAGRPYWVHQNILGEDGPLYVLIFPAADPADHWNYVTQTFLQSHAEAFQAMKREVARNTFSIMEMPGTERIDLALLPE